MPQVKGVFGIYGLEGNFRPYLGSSAVANDFVGLFNWRIRPKSELAVRPLRPGDLVFFHATRQRDTLNQKELEVKSEAGEFLPGFYTTSGTDLNDSIKLGWYWYECPKKTAAPKKDWHVLAFVLRKAYVESYLTSFFARDTGCYYLQAPRSFANGGANANAKDLQAIEFANRNGQVMIFPDKTTKVLCGPEGAKVSLKEFVFDRTGVNAAMDYAVIVGLQKPEPLDMRQQCWVSPNGLWHINQAERYEVFSRAQDAQQFAQIKGFVDQYSK